MRLSFFVIISLTIGLCVVYLILINTNDFISNEQNIRIQSRELWFKKNYYDDFHDYKKLMDIENFHFIIQQSSCSDLGIDIDLLIIIHTAPKHFDLRKAVRETWASQRLNGKYGKFLALFLLGEVADNEVQSMILHENLEYKDLIQGSFIDAYSNLTYKHLMGLKWHHYFCKNAKVVLKVDDDVFINTRAILRTFHTELWENYKDENNDFIVGNIMTGSEILRGGKTKYDVPDNRLVGMKYYPAYCSGYTIIYGSHTASKLYQEAQKMDYVGVDDAFISGVVRDRIGVNISEYPRFELANYDLFLENISPTQNYRAQDYFVGPFELNSTQVQYIWNELTNFTEHYKELVKE